MTFNFICCSFIRLMITFTILDRFQNFFKGNEIKALLVLVMFNALNSVIQGIFLFVFLLYHKR